MKAQKTFKIVMVPTEKAQPDQLIYQQTKDVYGKYTDKPILEFTTNETYIRNLVLMNSGKAATNSKSRNQFFELYIISDDAIKDNDHVECLGKIYKVSIAEKECLYFNDVATKAYRKDCKKIIASTDKEITPYSWIQESFIRAYVKAFTEGHPIKEVDLEIENVTGFSSNESSFEFSSSQKLGIRQDNSVIIRQSKTYSILQVEKILHDYREHAWQSGVSKNDLEKWIAKNL